MTASIAGAARTGTDAAVNAALDQLTQQREVRPWTSSLGEIENAAAALVESNRRLTAEYRALSNQLSAMEAAVKAQRQRNGDLERTLAAHQQEVGTPSTTGSEKQRLTEVERQVREARTAALSLESRLKAIDNKLALRQLKIQELDLEKKSLLLDRNARAGVSLGLLKQSVRTLKEQADTQKAQIDFTRQKISGLNAVDRSYLKDLARVSAENDKLRQELAQVSAERSERQKSVESAAERKNAAASPEARRWQELNIRKAALEARAAAAQARKEQLATVTEASTVSLAALTAQIKGLEDENKGLEESMGNVRENIAVLEYRMNSLTRYKNRNANRN